MTPDMIRKEIKEKWNDARAEGVKDFDSLFKKCSTCPNALFSLEPNEECPEHYFVSCFCPVFHRSMNSFPIKCMGTEIET